jgi:cell division topological specificity factor
MSGFFDRIMGRGQKESSASVAKDRLQFILVHDRINLPPEQLRAMKEEILAVISKYVSVESDKVDIALQQRDRDNSMLVAEIPFSKTRGSGKSLGDEGDDKADDPDDY